MKDQLRKSYYVCASDNFNIDADLHITLTGEGLIVDLIDKASGDIVDTWGATAQEFYDEFMNPSQEATLVKEGLERSIIESIDELKEPTGPWAIEDDYI